MGDGGGGGGGRVGSESMDRAIVSASCCVASRSSFKVEDDNSPAFSPPQPITPCLRQLAVNSTQNTCSKC